MQFKYNGKKKNMIAFGYDFSEDNDFTAEVPKSDKLAFTKLSGNGFFDKDGEKIVKELKLGVFKKKEDGKPYSRAEKVFMGPDVEELKLDALIWIEKKGLLEDDMILRVK